MKYAAAVALLLLGASPAFADDAADMKTTAASFYTVVVSDKTGGIPDAKMMARYTPLSSAALIAGLKQAATAEARFASRNKNSPPLVEGNVFTSLFEGATGFTVTGCEAHGAQGQCSIALTYQDKSGKPTSWTDKLLLTKEAGGWRADDIAYGGNWPFANSGMLRDTLKIAIGMSGK